MRTASINMSLLFVEITQTLTLRLGEGQKLVPEGHDSGTVSALSRLELAIDMEYVEQRELHSSIIGSRRSLEPPKLPIYHFDGKACHSSQILQTKRIQPAVIYKVAVRDTSVSKYPSLGIHCDFKSKEWFQEFPYCIFVQIYIFRTSFWIRDRSPSWHYATV